MFVKSGCGRTLKLRNAIETHTEQPQKTSMSSWHARASERSPMAEFTCLVTVTFRNFKRSVIF